MAFYKVCDCGQNNVFAHPGLSPRKCSVCGRSLLDVATQQGDAEVLDAPLPQEVEPMLQQKESGFYLVAVDGSGSFDLPEEGGIVGRSRIGADVLARHLPVSREHFQYVCRGKIGIQLEDCSKFGTWLNGVQLTKGDPTFVKVESIVKLYDFEMQLLRRR